MRIRLELLGAWFLPNCTPEFVDIVSRSQYKTYPESRMKMDEGHSCGDFLSEYALVKHLGWKKE